MTTPVSDIPVTFVVVSYNSEAVIGECLEAIERTVPGATCLVMDNGSTDGTEAAVLNCKGNIELISSASNDGFGRACNKGAKLAKTPFVAFVNPDCTVERFDLGEVRQFERDGRVGLLAAAIHDPGKPPEYLVKDFPRPWRHTWQHVLGPLVPSQLPAPPSFKKNRSSGWVSGAFFVVSRDEFLGLGGFDRAIFLYYEDTELGRRYCDAGLPVRLLELAVGSHEIGLSTDRTGLEGQFMTWSILSWLEYLSATNRETVALRHANLIRSGCAMVSKALEVAARLFPREPIRRKAAQYSQVSCGLDSAAKGSTGIAPPPTDPFYGRAVKLLSTRRG